MARRHKSKDDDNDDDDDDDEEEEWSLFSCPNPGCSDHGSKGKGNIRLKQKYGKNDVAELICRTCGKTFSENRGTPLFRLRLSYQTLYRILTSLVRGLGIRGTADVVGVNKNTVERILKVAGGHMKEFNDFMLRNLEMTQAQCDEFWTYVKSKRGARTSMALKRFWERKKGIAATRLAGRGTSP